jgi:inhibitor of KinA
MVTDTQEDPSDAIFLSAGDTALVIQYGETVDPEVNRRVRMLTAALAESAPEGIVDLVPTMRSLMIHYDPLVLSRARLVEVVRPLLEARPDLNQTTRRWRIPVCYEGECAPDLEAVAEATGLSPEEVVRQHCGVDQEVFMMGFLPGFPYLGLLPEIFDLPRRLEPRVKVPPRSISVAARQTTIYTVDSPGGWHLIGRTPVDFYNPARAEPILVAAGDRVRFEPVPLDEYHATRRAVEAGSYEIRCDQ